MANEKKLADLIAEARRAMKKEHFSSILVSNFFLAKYLIGRGVEIPVRCKDCMHFKPAHFNADDGTEIPWDETFSFDDRSDGIYHGGKCKHDRNTAYGQKDMAYRKPDDFCSYGERKDHG